MKRRHHHVAILATRALSFVIAELSIREEREEWRSELRRSREDLKRKRLSERFLARDIHRCTEAKV